MRAIAAFAFLALVSACTTPASTSASGGGHDCFRNQDINGWGALDAHTLKVHVGVNRDYALSSYENLSDFSFQETLAVRTRGSDWICTGHNSGVEISVGGPAARTVLINEVRRLPGKAPQGS